MARMPLFVVVATCVACARGSAGSDGAGALRADAAARVELPGRPGGLNHSEGSRLILAAVERGPLGAGVWFAGAGFLGTAMLEVSVENRAGYESFFYRGDEFGELPASFNSANWSLMTTMMWRGVKPEVTSLIAQRQAVLGVLAQNIHNRFAYTREGMWGFRPDPDAKRVEAVNLRNTIETAGVVLSKLTAAGVSDCVLADALSIATVVAAHDLPSISPRGRVTTQIYQDSFSSALKEFKKSGGLSGVVEPLAMAMRDRELCTSDGQGIFATEASHKAFVKLVEGDLAAIRKHGAGY